MIPDSCMENKRTKEAADALREVFFKAKCEYFFRAASGIKFRVFATL